MKVEIQKIAMGCKPDPYKFTILERHVINTHTIILAQYEGCLSFGGNKLRLCRGIIQPDIETLDPHFIEGHHIVARFEPTPEGMRLARICAACLLS